MSNSYIKVSHANMDINYTSTFYDLASSMIEKNIISTFNDQREKIRY
jgi:hypothetical protein